MKGKKIYVDVVLMSLFVVLTLVAFLKTPTSSSAATVNHIVISEIKVSGVTARDEFIEFYNPTDSDIDLSGWRLTRKTSSGSESNLIASLSGTIPAHGFYLITHPDNVELGADELYSVSYNSITDNNTLLLYSDAAITLVDKVAMGQDSSDPEATAAAQPEVGESLERKALSSSTIESMVSGTDVAFGNGEDSQNNSHDFIIRPDPQPQNSQSDKEFFLLATGTPTPTVSPTATPLSTQTPAPTLEPTNPPIPSPTVSVQPSPTLTPTPVPSITPEPTISPSSTPIPFYRSVIVCTRTYSMRTFSFFGRTISWRIPRISCHRS